MPVGSISRSAASHASRTGPACARSTAPPKEGGSTSNRAAACSASLYPRDVSGG